MVQFTVLIIFNGAEEFLTQCLKSLSPREESWQLLIVANGKPWVPGPGVDAVVIESGEVLTPGAACNLGFHHSRGEWILLLGESVTLSGQYWDVVRPLLKDPKIDVLGGPALPAKGLGLFSEALSIALASPLCTGATFSRHQGLGKKLVSADEEKLSELNLWVRSSAYGGTSFPADYLKASEVLMLQELKRKGAGIYYHPKLVVFHSLETSVREYFWEGFWRSRLIRRRLAEGSEVFWLPAVFVLLHLTAFLNLDLFLSMVKLYAGIIVFVSLGLAMKRHKLWLFPVVAFMHYFVVVLYGIGFLTERLKIKR